MNTCLYELTDKDKATLGDLKCAIDFILASIVEVNRGEAPVTSIRLAQRFLESALEVKKTA